MTAKLALALALALTLAISTGTLAACGGDDDKDKKADSTAATSETTSAAPGATTSAEPGEAPTKAEFIAQADTICTISRRETQETANRLVGNPGGKRPTAEQYQKIAAAVIPIARATGEQLKALTPPEGDEEEIRRYLDTGFKSLDKFDEAAKTPEGAQKLLTGESKLDEDADKLARAYGFKVCGKN